MIILPTFTPQNHEIEADKWIVFNLLLIRISLRHIEQKLKIHLKRIIVQLREKCQVNV